MVYPSQTRWYRGSTAFVLKRGESFFVFPAGAAAGRRNTRVEVDKEFMDYRQSLNLPNTPFPMKANLAQREPERLKKWEQERVYERWIEKGKLEGRKEFILHDGPPYANGHIHLGHTVNKVLKDFVLRSRTMDGYVTPFIPGWDTHGLPIEQQVLKEIGGNRHRMSPLEFRKKCREYALRYVGIQREEFKRLGVWGDWENPYLTLHPHYEAEQVRVFGAMAKKGYIYRGLKPVYWCPHCETALAEAEIEYADHRSDSVYVRFAVQAGRGAVAADGRTYVIIWTTTPWTLPANLAIAVHPQYDYALVAVGEERYVAAEQLVPALARALGWTKWEVAARVKGAELEGIVCRHPFLARDSKVVLAEYVTLEQGSGCVHIAPGHGIEDFEVGQAYGLDVLAPVDASGRFTAEAGVHVGEFVFDANRGIIEDMRRDGSLLGHEEIVHSYPHCWRCHQPIIFRATEQWFASVGPFRREALDAISRVQWVPAWGEDRIRAMVAERGDWCISRQRLWGVPLPIFYCTSCRHALIDDNTIEAVAALFEREGSDAWFTHEAAEILPAGTSCPKCGGTSFEKETDTMDVWFDSGSSHAAVLRHHPQLRWPADLYLEGSDQHRGWFQSSLLTSVATTGEPPFRAVLTHGFTVDAEGRKMSKSLGNVIAPQTLLQNVGADVLRLWVASADYRGDLRLSDEILEQVADVYRRIRNTARFLLGNLADFDPRQDRVPEAELTELDRWAVGRARKLMRRLITAYREYEFHMVYHAVHNFCAVDMGGFYLDVIKDRLYCEAPKSHKRRAAQTALHEILLLLVQAIAPILPFTAEEIWEHLPEASRTEPSVHFTTWPKELVWDEELDRRWEQLLAVRRVTARALEQARNEKMFGSSQEADVHLYAQDEAVYGQLAPFMADLAELLIVSRATLYRPGTPVEVEGVSVADRGVQVVVRRTDAGKCPRCWRFVKPAGAPDDALCDRCAQVVG